jgi:hypothetical protein
MPFGASKSQRALLFLSWLFFFIKDFNHIATMQASSILNGAITISFVFPSFPL